MADDRPSSDFLRAYAETRAYLLGRPNRIQFAPDGRSVFFLRSGPRDPTLGFFELSVATGEVREVCTPNQLLHGQDEFVSDAERARRERMRITDRGFTSYHLSPDGARVLLPLSGELFLLDRFTGTLRRLPLPAGDAAIDPRFSPNGEWVAFVRANDLWIVGTGAGAPPARPLTRGGSEALTHGLAEFVAQEEMARHEGYWWSPDSRSLAYAEVDQSQVETFSIADPAHPERAPQVFAYPRPGRANARVRLGVIGIDGKETRWVNWDEVRYPYLARVLWDGSAPLSVLVQTRDQREVAFLAVDENSGATWPLLIEQDEAWINLERDLPRWLSDGSAFLWASERSGRRTLALHRPDGAVERELMPSDSGFLSVAHVSSQEAFVLTGGPVINRIERVNLKDGRRSVLTADDAEHAPAFSRDGALYVDAVTSATQLPGWRLMETGGKERARLPDAAEPPPFRVNLELTTVGAQAFQAAIVRPHDFDVGRRYPVVLQVYGGPHALTVKADQRQYLFAQWLADQGAVVVCLDNRGTPRRGRDWERAIKGCFGDVPLEDQVAGLQALGARHPELDLDRVGVYGWSFGGYLAALAVLRRPDVFKVGVAGAPVVDWLDYDTHYTERYLDLPDVAPQAYRSSSLLTYASDLARPLLLIHGTADDNVYFFHSLKLADALFRAGTPADFLPLAGVTHQIADARVRERLWQRIAGYLFAHLNVAPKTR